MQPRFWRWLLILPLATAIPAGAAEHTVALGAWRIVKSVSDSGEVRELKVRRLLVDGKAREDVTGVVHEVTDRVYVTQRIYRINDSLPGDPKGPQWIWRLDGWISVDRASGHVAQLALPGFDPGTSEASWYRDYVAYCGAGEDSQGVLIVSQIGKRKPIVKKEFVGSGCAAPKWERGPTRVTFVVGGEKNMFVVRPRGADLQAESTQEGPQ